VFIEGSATVLRGRYIFPLGCVMALPEDLLDRLRDARRLGYALPSDLEMIVGELIRLRSEIEKIKKALEKHGIKVD